MHWNDFEQFRDGNKMFIIYGAAVNGHKFLNENRLVPDYFCDVNADKIKQIVSDDGIHKIECISPARLQKTLQNSVGADILVSSGDYFVVNQVVKQLSELFDGNTNLYIHHKIEIGSYREYLGEVKINGEYVVDGYAAVSCNLARQVDNLYRNFGDNKQDILDIFEVYEHFADMESKSIFLGQCKTHLSNRDSRYITEVLRASSKTNRFLELYSDAISRQKLVRVGASGKFKKSEIESVDKDSIVLIYSDYTEVKSRLHVLGVPQKNIYCDFEFYDKAYFSLPQMTLGEDEVFVDVGCFNGATTKDFIKLVNGKYRYIYAFEPDDELYIRSRDNTTDISRFTLLQVGLWDRNATLSFDNQHSGSSKITDTGTLDIQVVSLDCYLDGLPLSQRHNPTLIKMDIEGAELPALMGAQQTIRQYKPKLAICVYHLENNPFEIAKRILHWNPDYTLYMRHYSLDYSETVLYAL